MTIFQSARKIVPNTAHHRYSQQDGSAALPANSIKLPDDWVWAHEWKIDGSGGRDTGGWEYGKDLIKFNVSRGECRALDRVPYPWLNNLDTQYVSRLL